jgi:uncharacterized protein YjbJ (UPF0337 family)
LILRKTAAAPQRNAWLVFAKPSPRQAQHKLKELKMSMNKDQVKGALRDIGGKIQEEAGKLIGSTGQQVQGLKNQAKGKVQKGVGNLKEAVSHVKEATRK